MANALHFELASPQKLFCAKSVTMVTVPGAEGDFGVMGGHAPMAACVAMGVVHAFEGDQAPSPDNRWFVVGGFCEVTGERCTVMAEQVVPLKDLRRDVIEAEIAALAKAAQTEPEAEERLVIAQRKLLALAG